MVQDYTFTFYVGALFGMLFGFGGGCILSLLLLQPLQPSFHRASKPSDPDLPKV